MENTAILTTRPKRETETKHLEALLLLRRRGKGISVLLVLKSIGVIFYERL